MYDYNGKFLVKMKKRATTGTQKNLIAEITAKQQNNVWPGPIANSRSIDEYLWKGSQNATLVQRIGACIIGLFYFSMGVIFLGFARGDLWWPVTLLSFLLLFLGTKIFLNGFRNRKLKSDQRGNAVRRIFPGLWTILKMIRRLVDQTGNLIPIRAKQEIISSNPSTGSEADRRQ
jgi:hypothetical protein